MNKVREENIARLMEAGQALMAAMHTLMLYDVDYNNLTNDAVEEFRDVMAWVDKASELALAVYQRVATLTGGEECQTYTD